MIFSAIIFVISVLIISTMWRVKNLELSTGQVHSVLDLTHIDEKIIGLWRRWRTHMRDVFIPRMKELFHSKLVHAENRVITMFWKYVHKLGHIADIVRGKDLPKNRGSVSFYWQHLDSMK